MKRAIFKAPKRLIPVRAIEPGAVRRLGENLSADVGETSAEERRARLQQQ